ncbi:uncharacterized protein HMPREF1541_03024 [Cyphellophora europaea CBS 101466]|uniref:Inner centromere protein ARK-binding domain-containing protein n=1 Tax=Cyphellophora europaea (strain CBS 101466) TaxID=1220924 RepID=W2RZH9_CYPE1|nr:uncharacterized protein HMPREF1541_03024 [Cyphellophora europaea CBS 101466]ETN41089.1 hypothetical protein HMPREF1541_03024 [Cyphellophora europaea CBS 101466]
MAKAVGSAAWVAAEKENVLDLLREEKEELIFPAQHELEWLNEHMNDIFTTSHVNITDVFKTPGKMHGKTPKTNRKRNAAETRVPLSDVFSAQPAQRQQSPVKTRFAKPPPRFEIPADVTQTQTQKTIIPSQADSGYHTSSQSQADPDETAPLNTIHEPARFERQSTDAMVRPERERSPGRRTTEGSFHSAKEDQTTKILAKQAEGPQPEPAIVSAPELEPQQQEPEQAAFEPESAPPADVDMDDIGSPSDESTPDRPLVRKGSLNFASLPAREPMKTSIGARISHQKKSFGPARNSQSLHHASHSSPKQDFDHSDDDDVVMEDSHIQILGRDESEDEQQPIRSTNETAAQRLQKKIEMLGKAPPPRASKSIPSVLQMVNRKSEAPKPGEKEAQTDADDDDWIKPLESASRANEDEHTDEDMDSDRADEFDVRAPELIAHEQRMAAFSPSPPRQRPGFGHAKSASTATLVSPAKLNMAPTRSPAKSISVSNPQQQQQPTTTPQGSPRRYLDLSASKSRLQSIMKSAKGLFTSSASVSAAAKMETLSPTARQANAMPGMFPRGGSVLEDKPLPKSPLKEGRRTRSSTEREKEEKRKDNDVKAMEKMDEQLQKAREKEAQKAAMQKQQHSEKEAEDAQPQSRIQRPPKAIREPVQKTKPAPVAIKVGTMSQRVPIGSSIANASQETLTAEPKRPGLTKKASTSSISSNTHFKTSVQSQPTKPKALLAAERKREADEREAKRKAEAKRELERKREEARQQEAKLRAETERKERERAAAEQAKRQAEQQAKQQAIERKRQEAARKAEQQRMERATQDASRPPSRAGGPPMSRSLIGHPIPTNPAKPAKRPVDEETARPQASKFGQASQQQDAKRRRTEDEQETQRPTMSGAPIRQSNFGKKPSIFNHSSYAPAPQPGQLGQFPQPPNRMAPPQMGQYAHSKIPFGESSNQPIHNKTPASASHKTPASAFKSTIQPVKSSPQYTPGEQINLPEIPTDSEDEDSDDEGNAFPIPDWATPGHLTEQLIRQEGMDGDAVFGPIAPLKMEEIFAKGNKERLKRLRDRTSSANWAMSGDGLTLEEVRIDREQRERMRVQGGWVYGQGK